MGVREAEDRAIGREGRREHERGCGRPLEVVELLAGVEERRGRGVEAWRRHCSSEGARGPARLPGPCPRALAGGELATAITFTVDGMGAGKGRPRAHCAPWFVLLYRPFEPLPRTTSRSRRSARPQRARVTPRVAVGRPRGAEVGAHVHATARAGEEAVVDRRRWGTPGGTWAVRGMVPTCVERCAPRSSTGTPRRCRHRPAGPCDRWRRSATGARRATGTRTSVALNPGTVVSDHEAPPLPERSTPLGLAPWAATEE